MRSPSSIQNKRSCFKIESFHTISIYINKFDDKQSNALRYLNGIFILHRFTLVQQRMEAKLRIKLKSTNKIDSCLKVFQVPIPKKMLELWKDFCLKSAKNIKTWIQNIKNVKKRAFLSKILLKRSKFQLIKALYCHIFVQSPTPSQGL